MQWSQNHLQYQPAFGLTPGVCNSPLFDGIYQGGRSKDS
jgi:hypothetical protein